jgi:hypothetical protein
MGENAHQRHTKPLIIRVILKTPIKNNEANITHHVIVGLIYYRNTVFI